MNFYDKQKNIKAKIENKIFSTVEELDTIRTINCEVFIPKSDSRCEPCQVFCEHLRKMTHHDGMEKKVVVSTLRTSICLEWIWRRKLQEFLNQQKKRNEAKIEKLFRSNKVSLNVDIDEKLNDRLI